VDFLFNIDYVFTDEFYFPTNTWIYAEYLLVIKVTDCHAIGTVLGNIAREVESHIASRLG